MRTLTSALGVYAALMPTGPADIYFTKALRTTRSLSIEVGERFWKREMVFLWGDGVNVVGEPQLAYNP